MLLRACADRGTVLIGQRIYSRFEVSVGVMINIQHAFGTWRDILTPNKAHSHSGQHHSIDRLQADKKCW